MLGGPGPAVAQSSGLQLHLRHMLTYRSCRLLLGLQRLLKPHCLHVPHLNRRIRRPLPACQHWRRRCCRLRPWGRGWTVHTVGCQDHVDDGSLRAKASLRSGDSYIETPEPEFTPRKKLKPFPLVKALERPQCAWPQEWLKVYEVLLLAPVDSSRPHHAGPAYKATRSKPQVLDGISAN